MLWGCEGKELWREPIEVTHIYSLEPLVSVADISRRLWMRQKNTYSSRLKSLSPHNPSSFAFHTP